MRRDAERLLSELGETKKELARLEKRYSLKAKQAHCSELSRELADVMVELDEEELLSGGYSASLVERWPTKWLVYAEDAAGLELKEKDRDYVPLIDLLSPDDLLEITNLVADPKKIDDAVKQGRFTLEQVQQAFVEYFQTRYVQVAWE